MNHSPHCSFSRRETEWSTCKAATSAACATQIRVSACVRQAAPPQFPWASLLEKKLRRGELNKQWPCLCTWSLSPCSISIMAFYQTIIYP